MSESDSAKQSPAPVRTLWRSMKMVAWAFLGIRKGSESQEDVATASPVHIVVAGLLGGAIFVTCLVLLVNWIVAG